MALLLFTYMTAPWDFLESAASDVVQETLASLPEPLRARAANLPIVMERAPNLSQGRDGIEEDTLGLFIGPEFADQEITPDPPHIVLFLENLWEMVGRNPDEYRAEVRTTLLHELGHYLGLDEDDLTDRGLD